MKLKGKRFTPAMIVAMVALGVALSGTAVAGTAKLITSSQIKDGSITLSDINANARKALKKAHTGATGAKGDKGETGSQGPVGPQGENVRWERVVGSCTSSAPGEVMVIDESVKLGLPNVHGAYAQFKMLVENVRLADVSKLSFDVKLEGSSNVYMKLKLEDGNVVVFQPGAQTTKPNSTEFVKYDVTDAASIVRASDFGPETDWATLKADLGDKAVKSLEITGGCAGSANDGDVLVDDVTLNNTVIDFS